DPGPALLAWWKFDDGSGVDSALFHHDGTLAGPTASSDVPSNLGAGQSLSFDGSSYVSVPDAADLTLGQGNFTISLWAKFASSGPEMLLSHDEGGGDINKWIFGYNIGGQTTGHLLFLVGGPSMPQGGSRP